MSKRYYHAQNIGMYGNPIEDEWIVIEEGYGTVCVCSTQDSAINTARELSLYAQGKRELHWFEQNWIFELASNTCMSAWRIGKFLGRSHKTIYELVSNKTGMSFYNYRRAINNQRIMMGKGFNADTWKIYE